MSGRTRSGPTPDRRPRPPSTAGWPTAARRADWKHWGPYVSERAWGTVREDYSADGDAWDYFPHDHARSRAYRWGEDGLAGFCDRFQNLCFALALWNGRDPILKERLFGLTDAEGNHGEDVKEYYFYLDATPTPRLHADALQVPAGEYPYARLVEENRRRRRAEPEFELVDARRAFARGPLLRRVRRVRQGRPGGHPLPDHGDQPRARAGRAAHPAARLVPQHLELGPRPASRARAPRADGPGRVRAEHRAPRRALVVRRRRSRSAPELLFTENETNAERLFGAPNASPYVKDGFHDYVVGGRRTR